MNRFDLAQLIVSQINSDPATNFQCKVWRKNKNVRVYIKDLDFKNEKDRGFLLIDAQGKVDYSGKKRNTYLPDVDALEMKAEPENELTFSSRYLTGNEAFEQSAKDHPPQDFCFGAADEESF